MIDEYTADAIRLIAEELAGEAMVRADRLGLRRAGGAQMILGVAYGLAVSKTVDGMPEPTVEAIIGEALRFAAENAHAFRTENSTRLRKPTT